MRWVVYLGSACALVAAILLIAFARHTDDYFAWTVRPAMTAAALGAFFWAAALFGYMSARRRDWADARAGLPAGIVFTLLALVITFIYIDRLHLSGVTRLTLFLTYAWLAVCVIAPPLLIAAFYLQLRAPGGDPRRTELLPLPYRVLMAIQGLIAIVTGAVLLLNPAPLIPHWGWDLNPLDGRALGTWLVPVGMLVWQAIRENDWERARPALISLTVLGALQLVVFGAYYDGLLLGNASAIAWVAFWLATLFLDGYGVIESLRVSRIGTKDHRAAEAA